MSRKDKLLRNLGGTVAVEKSEACDIVGAQADRTSVIMIERLIHAIGDGTTPVAAASP